MIEKKFCLYEERGGTATEAGVLKFLWGSDSIEILLKEVEELLVFPTPFNGFIITAGKSKHENPSPISNEKTSL